MLPSLDSQKKKKKSSKYQNELKVTATSLRNDDNHMKLNFIVLNKGI